MNRIHNPGALLIAAGLSVTPLSDAFVRFFRTSYENIYLPMQKVEKIWFRISSAVVSPVRLSRWRSAA